jgi:hypothetical protein
MSRIRRVINIETLAIGKVLLYRKANKISLRIKPYKKINPIIPKLLRLRIIPGSDGI